MIREADVKNVPCTASMAGGERDEEMQLNETAGAMLTETNVKTGTLSSGEATTGCIRSYRSTSKTTAACATCVWCQGGKRPSKDKLA